ncbi:MAG TPA: GNAT family N-acetyltransferase, partial [Anaerolineae bacterium]|nr:GNAT family N-acetyltransferase [Anaerolineae bacterium]
MMGDGVKLRAGVAADEAEIKGLIKEYGLNPLGLDWRRFLVAVDGAGNFVGCGQLKPHGDGSLELASLAVVRAWREKGVGRLLMEGLMRRGERPWPPPTPQPDPRHRPTNPLH